MPDSLVTGSHSASGGKPYRIACLCDLRDEKGRVLVLHRKKEPNKGLCSPIGGKLDVAAGESPAQCAQREIFEEAGLRVPIERLHLIGLVSECEFEGKGHWLMFIYRVLGAVWVEPREMAEGRLEWYFPEELQQLPIPESDRKIIWPLINRADGIGGELGAPAPGTGTAPAPAPGPGSPLRTGSPLGVMKGTKLAEKPGFFAVHIDCRGGGMTWTVEEERLPPPPPEANQ